ncbi:glycosyltransferase family 2 protein [Pseudalkalibacillus sp. NRS-1564]|uniref:glycosyltransferase family 2 protein n=1 Tax=Pseudalkalibacillus sp. NRS-1564 TaxID=3233900 RepID=UPI003D296480
MVTPCYNSAFTIKETIDSVISQTYENWEHIIVDDCSKDNSTNIIVDELAHEPRIKLIKMKSNSGAAEARNMAIEKAKGKYIAFLDSDDLWHPEKLYKQVKFMEENDLSFSFTNYRIIKETGERTNKVVIGPKSLDYYYLLKNTIIGTLTVMLNIEKIGPIKMVGNLNCTEDFALWLVLLKKGHNAHRLNEELAYYRKSKQSDSGNKLKSAKETWNTYRRTQKISVIKTVWYFSHYSFNAYRKHAKL